MKDTTQETKMKSKSTIETHNSTIYPCLGSKTDIRKGIVKFYAPSKGFGFVTDENGRDHFFHKSDVPTKRSIRGKTMRLSFTLARRRGG